MCPVPTDVICTSKASCVFLSNGDIISVCVCVPSAQIPVRSCGGLSSAGSLTCRQGDGSSPSGRPPPSPTSHTFKQQHFNESPQNHQLWRLNPLHLWNYCWSRRRVYLLLGKCGFSPVTPFVNLSSEIRWEVGGNDCIFICWEIQVIKSTVLLTVLFFSQISPLFFLLSSLPVCPQLQQLCFSFGHLVSEDTALELHATQQPLQLLHLQTLLLRLILCSLQPLRLLHQTSVILVVFLLEVTELF